MRDFYVYLHRKKTTGEVFYVGKGSGRRAYDRRGRSRWWKSTVEKHGYIVEIYMDCLQEWYAFELEKDLISLYGRRDKGEGSLVNACDGGEGNSGAIHTPERKAQTSLLFSSRDSPTRDKTVYSFVNIKTLQEVKRTRYDFQNEFNIDPSGLFSGKLTAKGWCLKSRFERATNKLVIGDKSIYRFENADGSVFSGTRAQFRKKYNIEPYPLVHNQVNFLKGWVICDGRAKVPKEDTIEYCFLNKKTGDIFNGTRTAFRKQYGFTLDDLFRTKALSSYNNWCIVGKYSKFPLYSYSIQNKTTGKIFTGQRFEFEREYPEVKSSIFCENNVHFTNGWKVIEKLQFNLYCPIDLDFS